MNKRIHHFKGTFYRVHKHDHKITTDFFYSLLFILFRLLNKLSKWFSNDWCFTPWYYTMTLLELHNVCACDFINFYMWQDAIDNSEMNTNTAVGSELQLTHTKLLQFCWLAAHETPGAKLQIISQICVFERVIYMPAVIQAYGRACFLVLMLLFSAGVMSIRTMWSMCI